MRLALIYIVGMICLLSGYPMMAGTEAVSRFDFFSPLENEIWREMNLARVSPQQYASEVEKLIPHFVGKRLVRPGEIDVITREGVRAVKEAVRFLRRAPALPKLKPSRGLSLGARDHVTLQGPSGRIGHWGTDGTSAAERVNRYGQWQRTLGENIIYGHMSARDFVISQIVDDGVPDRGHRNHIFNADFLVVGVACGSHVKYRTMCVVTFSGAYQERSRSP